MSKSEGLHRDWHQAAQTLSEALPYILRYAGKTVLIKYGGHAMGEDDVARRFARDIVLIKQVGVKPIVVHGGGPQIGQMLDRLGIKSNFIDGLRVTDAKTVEVVEMVLAGSINKQIVSFINSAGGKAVGLSGKDGNLIQARKLRRTTRDPESNIEKVLELGFVGEPSVINPDVLQTISASDLIPVVAPIGIGEKGETYNINADTAAGAIAGAVRAMRLLMLTDVPGVLDEDGKVIPHLSKDRALAMIKSGAIAGGMIPKVETCLDALAAGVGGVVILDGRVEHAVLLELFTEHGAGTLIS
ncbi:MAG: acetylglutamate kinase [Alphaproteobacteria bacterium]|nr:acetylglutamate kinase [Alphaproteobacteria bacterium]